MFARQCESILVLLQVFSPSGFYLVFFLILGEFFFFGLPSSECGLIASLDVSDLPPLITVVLNVVVESLMGE